ncbi:hypothetical protein BH20VER1_BH20VER1_24170 [soil metagenome]
MNSVRPRLTSAILALTLIATLTPAALAQQAIWTQFWDLQSHVEGSSLTTDNQHNIELADDFQLIGTISVVQTDGSRIAYFGGPAMNLQSAHVRFYEWNEGIPGELQYEQLVPASAITVESHSTGEFNMRIPLPASFSASGKHFISVQTVSDLVWWWGTANSSDPLLSTGKFRNRATNSSWSTPRQSDLALVLYGTLEGPPLLQGISDATLPRSGRLRITGSSFGTTQGAGEVRIGGLPAIVTRWNNTTIHAYVPEALTPGQAAVQIVTANGSSSTLPLLVTERTSPS